ncbi:uncharacterized protein [Halyomorpha halys]|uniref:uncharacterized protein n=1 Tax=Halyomorpha halys TaxID=286706 RepID=UPI0006D4ED09|nr:kininogen-1-like [Halyomorpha halys]
MLFNNYENQPKPSPEMFSGTYGVWYMNPHHRGPNPFEKRHHKDPNPHQMGFYIVPMMGEKWHHKDNKPHGGCPGRNHWRHGLGHHGHGVGHHGHGVGHHGHGVGHHGHGLGHHEMNPQKFHEMFYKMQKQQSKEQSACGTSASHRHGFCMRRFAAENKKEQQQNPIPPAK